MRVLSHPFRLDANGQAVTVAQGSSRHAGAVVSTVARERGVARLCGDHGRRRHSDDGVNTAEAIRRCEPDLTVTGVTVDYDASGLTTVRVSVEWAEE